MRLIPVLSMFVQLPENLANSTGFLSSSGEFSGNRTDTSSLELNSEIRLTEITLDEVKLDDSTLNCTIGDKSELKIGGNFDEAQINITGPFPAERQDALAIHATGIDFDDLMKIANSADIGGTAELSAELLDGTLTGFMKIPNATFNDIPIGAVAGDFRYQEGRVFIENGLMTKNTVEATSGLQTAYRHGSPTESLKGISSSDEAPQQGGMSVAESDVYSRTTITGTVEVRDDFPVDISVVADPVYVQHYPKLLLGAEYPVGGEIRGELKLSGTLVHLDGRADFSVTEGVAWGIRLDPLTLPLEIEDYNFTVPDFKITTRGQQITFNIAVAPNGDYALLLESDAPVELEEIAKAADLSDFPFEGQFDVRVVGMLKKPARPDIQVELDFSDLTFLHNERGRKYPLGDVYLLGKLVERKDTTGEPDIYDFRGHGFERTSQIQGYISMATGNPYRFTAESESFDITPILPILDPMLEAVTGTAGGRASINGTLADLAPSTENEAAESQKQHVYPYDVDILVNSSQLSVARRGWVTQPLQRGSVEPDPSLTDNSVPFTNSEPIRLHLKDDTWTIDALSLRTSESLENPFLELTGTLDARSETMSLHAVSDGFALLPFEEALGLPLGTLKTGALRYDVKMTGTSIQPNIRLEWSIPRLILGTDGGAIDIADASGVITYQEETLRFEGCDFKLFGNDVNLEGYIDVHPEAVNNSELHLRVDTVTLDLATLPAEVIETLGTGEGVTGILEASVEIGGTLAEPLVLLYAETIKQRPIRVVSYIPATTLERLRVDIHFDSEFIRVQRLEANGQIGEGPYRVQGKAVFPRGNSDQPSAVGDQHENSTSPENLYPLIRGDQGGLVRARLPRPYTDP